MECLAGPGSVALEGDVEPLDRRRLRVGQVQDRIPDDLWPDESRTHEHFRQVRRVLGDDAVFVKNVIWSTQAAQTRTACEEAQAALAEVFPQHLTLALGKPSRGHNRLLIGATGRTPLTWPEVRERLAEKVPSLLLENVQAL